VVVDVALSNQFPGLNSLPAGNLQGNFSRKRHLGSVLASNTGVTSMVYEQIPCALEQGIFYSKQRIELREQGICEFAQIARHARYEIRFLA
jgi:hypothetical protein